MQEYIPPWTQVKIKNALHGMNTHTAFVYKGKIILYGGLGQDPNLTVTINPGFTLFLFFTMLDILFTILFTYLFLTLLCRNRSCGNATN